MRRIRITKNQIVHTVSMQTVDQLVNYLNDNYSFNSVEPLANTIWNLNVGKSVQQDDYTFSCSSKSRAGKHFVI